MTDERKLTAREKAEAHREQVMRDAHPRSPGSSVKVVSWKPEDSFMAGYRQAVEEAAKVAREMGKSVKGGYVNATYEIAEAIEKLAGRDG